MKIVIVGCGKVGSTILESMVKERHDVLVVDSDPEVISKVVNTYDVMGLCGNGTSYEQLAEADVGKAELFIAVTGSDELNMLSCFVAKRMGAKHTVARIRSSEYNRGGLDFIKEQMALSMVINPELLCAQNLFNLIKLPTAATVQTFAGKKFELTELLVRRKSALDGVTLMDLRKKYPVNFLVCAVQRGDKAYIPNGSFEIKSGDKVGIMASQSDTYKLLNMLDYVQKQARTALILGASNIAYYLADLLQHNGYFIKVIEKDNDRCLEFCEKLGNVTVINGDGTSQDLLLEEGIESTGTFVALTGNDEQNILISFYAMSQGVPKVISKVNREELSAISEKLGLDTTVSPKRIVADVLVGYARALNNTLGSNIETLYSIMNGKAEALEFKVLSDFRYTEMPLKQIRLREGILIAGIVRGTETIIPSGDDVIKAGDRVVVVAAERRLSALSDIVAK